VTRAQAPSPESLAAVVSAFKGRRVAVLGDLVCDEFVHGDIARVSREAPVLILEQTRVDLVPGGGGNAVANLRALGAIPIPVGVVGRDEAGLRLLALFRRSGVTTAGIAAERGYGTPTKSRVLAGGVHTRRQQIVRVDRGQRHGELPADVAARLSARLGRALRGAEGLLVADYGYGAATPSHLRAVRSQLSGKTVTVDSRARVTGFRRVAGCTPNQEELENAIGLSGDPDDRRVTAAGHELLRRTGDRTVLVTRGAKGMVLFRKDAPPFAVPPFGSGEVADVTGAGDTVIATYTLALLAGASPEAAAVIANTAAGIVVMKYGTATVGPRELTAALRSGKLP
jgi:D-glycero-beta-D-manno-heptose-7-phosphate kinase